MEETFNFGTVRADRAARESIFTAVLYDEWKSRSSGEIDRPKVFPCGFISLSLPIEPELHQLASPVWIIIER